MECAGQTGTHSMSVQGNQIAQQECADIKHAQNECAGHQHSQHARADLGKAINQPAPAAGSEHKAPGASCLTDCQACGSVMIASDSVDDGCT
jgi:hypothetical protein